MEAEVGAVRAPFGNTSGRLERQRELKYERLLALTRLAHARAALERHVPESHHATHAADHRTGNAISAYDAAMSYAVVAIGGPALRGIHPLALSLRHGRAMLTDDADFAATELRGIVDGYTRLYRNPHHPLLLQAQADLLSVLRGGEAHHPLVVVC
jgi:hypothetical protein